MVDTTSSTTDPAVVQEMERSNDIAEQGLVEADRTNDLLQEAIEQRNQAIFQMDRANDLAEEKWKDAKPLEASWIRYHEAVIAQLQKPAGVDMSPPLQVWMNVFTAALSATKDRLNARDTADDALEWARERFPELGPGRIEVQ